MTIEVYTFENADGDEWGFFTTQELEEARSYARENKLRLIANTFEWTDSELLEDHTPRRRRNRRRTA